MGGKAWRTPSNECGDDGSERGEQQAGRWRSQARSATPASTSRGAAGWGNAGGRRWVTRTDDTQLLRSMAAGLPSAPLRRSGRCWAAPVDYSEPEASRKQSA